MAHEPTTSELDGTRMLSCVRCRGTFQEIDFYLNRHSKTGRQAYCKGCHRLMNKAARLDPQASRVYFTTSTEAREQMHRAARAMRFTLNEWIRWACDLALERQRATLDADLEGPSLLAEARERALDTE